MCDDLVGLTKHVATQGVAYRENLLGIEARVKSAQIAKTLDHEPRAREQHERQRDLGDDQSIAETL